jgi:phosphoglycerol transferase MdoB-like AlkP superfamily enzyme
MSFIFTPLKNLFITFAGEPHGRAVSLFSSHFFNNLFSFGGLFGGGISARFSGYDIYDTVLLYTESGYGAIFSQLGLVGLVSLLFLLISVITRISYSQENKFFVLGLIMSIAVLLLFAGYPFGYKTFGLIYLFLGFIMVKQSSSCSLNFGQLADIKRREK